MKYIPIVAAVIIGIIITLVGLSIWNRTREAIDSVTTKVVTDTVYMDSGLVDTLVMRGTRPYKPTIVERITTQEVEPDTVYVSRADSIYVTLPNYGIQEVDKEDDKLTVTVLQRQGEEAQKLVYTLPDESSDYKLISGDAPAHLRVDRGWKVVDLKAELIGVVGMDGSAMAVATGPVSISPARHLQISPAVMYDTDTGVGVGVAVTLDF